MARRISDSRREKKPRRLLSAQRCGGAEERHESQGMPLHGCVYGRDFLGSHYFRERVASRNPLIRVVRLRVVSYALAIAWKLLVKAGSSCYRPLMRDG